MSNGRLATIAASTLLVGSSVSMLWGHGGDTTQIHSCVAKDGTIRIVGATTTCKSQETALDWSITGPQGPQGPQGDPGPQGPRGPSDAYVADAGLNPQEFAITNNEVTVATLSLPEGNYALNAKVLVGNRDAAEAEIVCTLRWAQSGFRLRQAALQRCRSQEASPLGPQVRTFESSAGRHHPADLRSTGS